MLIFLLALVSADPQDDLITKMPNAPSVSFKMYSGYLPVTNGKKLHYFFAESQTNPKSDPLVLWLNGGPGCSSMQGALMENGPFFFDGTSPNPKINPYAWNRNASMIYIESPAGVGYSVAGDQSNLNTNDNITASDNLNAIVQFYSKFPEYKTNEFYIMGQSYAGIYVPMLAYQVLKYNNNTKDKISIKGFAVGNGAVDWSVDVFSAWPYVLFWHGLIGYDTWIMWESNSCTWDSTVQVCVDAFQTMMYQFSGINYYDIYRPCDLGVGDRSQHKVRWGGLGDIDNCIADVGLTNYMNLPEVRKAMHIDDSLGAWLECSNDLNYTIFYDLGSFYLYPELISSELRIRIYSGDTDTAVATAGTRQWIKKLNMTEEVKWTSWSLGGQVSGFYKIMNDEKFTFMTIKGSGHMCIQWKRPEGFQMFSTFLEGKRPDASQFGIQFGYYLCLI